MTKKEATTVIVTLTDDERESLRQALFWVVTQSNIRGTGFAHTLDEFATALSKKP